MRRASITLLPFTLLSTLACENDASPQDGDDMASETAGEPQVALHAFAEIINDWRRQGNVTHLVISLRNLVDLFARVGAADAAGELLGALQLTSVTAPYGAEAQRLTEARATLERTAGGPAVARWVAQGQGHDLRAATTTALAAITALLNAGPTEQDAAAI